MDDSMDDSMDQSNHLTKRQKTHNGIQIHQYDTQTISNSTIQQFDISMFVPNQTSAKRFKIDNLQYSQYSQME